MEMARSARKSFLIATPDVLHLRWSGDNGGGDAGDNDHHAADGDGDGPPPENENELNKILIQLDVPHGPCAPEVHHGPDALDKAEQEVAASSVE